ncbi:nucleotidyltransferase family protein [Natronoarchaeum sp. GCM10025703]|uniref:nucleotidyltransferase family protein n=1 Tax=unclassified Natronoarchaeum TaxID=2620183 RepID=UPI00361E65A1
MHAVVPTTGMGTRLRPLTSETPKGLVEVAGTPILTHCFEHLVELGIDEIIVIVGYEGQQIIDHYGDAFGGISLTYAWQEHRRGLAHALVQARDHVEGACLVVNGDNVFSRSPRRLFDAFHEEDVDGVVYVESVSIFNGIVMIEKRILRVTVGRISNTVMMLGDKPTDEGWATTLRIATPTSKPDLSRTSSSDERPIQIPTRPAGSTHCIWERCRI